MNEDNFATQLQRLYDEAISMHHHSIGAMSAAVGVIDRKLRADADFIRAFGHLVPQPMPTTAVNPQAPDIDERMRRLREAVQRQGD